MPSDTLRRRQPRAHAEVLDALRLVHDPCSVATGIPIDIVDMGLIGSVRRDGSSVEIGLCLTSPVCWQAVGMMEAIEATLLRVDGIERVHCELDRAQHWTPDRMNPAARRRLRAVRETRTLTTRPNRQRRSADAEIPDPSRAESDAIAWEHKHRG
jgi:metal-sulfur cluster biosynthetic enzyme